jgi:hypothetical protein
MTEREKRPVLARNSLARRDWFETTPAGWGSGAAVEIDDDATFDTFRARHERVGRIEFGLRYPNPFLLFRMPSPGGRSNSRDRTLSPDEFDELGTPGLGTTLIAPARDGNRGEFASVVSIGRTEDNDIVIRHPCISRFQAYLTFEGDRMTVTDGGSLNGTQVEGERLPANVQMEVRSGTRMTFGRTVSALLLSPMDTWACLRGKQLWGIRGQRG